MIRWEPSPHQPVVRLLLACEGVFHIAWEAFILWEARPGEGSNAKFGGVELSAHFQLYSRMNIENADAAQAHLHAILPFWVFLGVFVGRNNDEICNK